MHLFIFHWAPSTAPPSNLSADDKVFEIPPANAFCASDASNVSFASVPVNLSVEDVKSKVEPSGSAAVSTEALAAATLVSESVTEETKDANSDKSDASAVAIVSATDNILIGILSFLFIYFLTYDIIC